MIGYIRTQLSTLQVCEARIELVSTEVDNEKLDKVRVLIGRKEVELSDLMEKR